MNRQKLDILFVSRAGLALSGQGVNVRANWPFGRMGLTADLMILKAGLRRYQLNFTDIDQIRFGWLVAQVEHHAPGVPGAIKIWGFLLSQRLRKAIEQYRLQIHSDAE